MHPLEPQYRILLTLVRLALGHQAEPFKGPVDWRVVFGLAVFHKLPAVALDGMELLRQQGKITPEEDLTEEIKDKLATLVVSCEVNHERIRKSMAEMAAFYGNHGIKMMVLKGYALSLDWPIPNHRMPGDIDIWLFGRQQEADELLKKEKGIVIDNSHHHHTTFRWGKVLVENHYDFINVHHHRSYAEMEKLFKELGQDDSLYTEIDGEKVYMPTPKLASLFLLKHTMLHFASYDFCLRQLLDWAFYAEKHGHELDWNWLMEQLERFGMLPLFHIFNAICIEEFGFDPAIFPPVQADPVLKERVRQEMFYPKFKGGEPKLPFLKRILYKILRWKGGLWKQRLCSTDSMWSVFWSGVWSHILKPATI